MNYKTLAVIVVTALSAAQALAAADGAADAPVVVKELATHAPPSFPICGSIAAAVCSADSRGYPLSKTCDVVKYRGLTYWPLSFKDNRYGIIVAGYGETGPRVKTVGAAGTRYVWNVTVDGTQKTVTFFGQADSKASLRWEQLAATDASTVTCPPPPHGSQAKKN